MKSEGFAIIEEVAMAQLIDTDRNPPDGSLSGILSFLPILNQITIYKLIVK